MIYCQPQQPPLFIITQHTASFRCVALSNSNVFDKLAMDSATHRSSYRNPSEFHTHKGS